MREATPDELATWDKLICQNPDSGNMLQSRAWVETKIRDGWKPQYFIHETAQCSLATLFLVRHIAFLGELWYAPKGPGFSRGDDMGFFIKDIKEAAPNSFLIKIEPEIPRSMVTDAMLDSAGARRAPVNVQLTVSSMVLNLQGDMEKLRSTYKQKTRYNIGVAKRHDVTVIHEEPSRAVCEKLATLLETTIHRAHFTGRTHEYFIRSWEAFIKRGQGDIFLAYRNNVAIAGAFIVSLGTKAWYKDGGSTRNDRSVMAPYLLHDTIIEWLHTKGIESYDFGSVPPEENVEEGHPLYGLYRFKSGFAPEHHTYVGTIDIPLGERAYERWNRFGESVAAQYFSRIRNTSLY